MRVLFCLGGCNQEIALTQKYPTSSDFSKLIFFLFLISSWHRIFYSGVSAKRRFIELGCEFLTWQEESSGVGK